MANWQWLKAPTWPQVISALPPIRASAAMVSARRHNSGRGAAIMPARITPRRARIFSTVLGNWMPTIAVGRQPHLAQPAGNRRDHAVGFGESQPPRRAVGERHAVRRIGQRQRAGPPLRDAAENVVERHAVLPRRTRLRWQARHRRGSLQRPRRLAPPGFRQVAVQRGPRRMLDIGPARHPLRRQIKQRHDVAAGNQHAVERAHRGDEIGALARAAASPRSWRRPPGCARPCNCASRPRSAAAEPQ